MDEIREGDNGSNTPNPVHTTIQDDFAAMERLPKKLRLASIETLYIYDAGQLLAMYQHFLSVLGFPSLAVDECIRQLALNDAHIKQKEMEAKWLPLQPISAPSNLPQRNSPTRRTALTAYRSGIGRSPNGSTPPNGKSKAPMPEFSLFGEATKPLKTPTIHG